MKVKILYVLCFFSITILNERWYLKASDFSDLPHEIRQKILLYLPKQDFMSARHSCSSMYTSATLIENRRSFKLKEVNNISDNLKAAIYSKGFFNNIRIEGPISSIIRGNDWSEFFSKIHAERLIIKNIDIRYKELKN